MLLLQKPNHPMDQDFANGLTPSPYDPDRQRRPWGEQVPYSAPYPPDATTQLPPIQTQRNAYEQTSTNYDPIRRPQPLPTSLGQSYSPYTTQTPQSPYGAAIPQYQHNAHMFSQNTPQMSPIAQQYSTSTYSPIRPMPALAPGQAHPLSAGYAQTPNYSFPSQTDESEIAHRSHVVGSQGRRGILPSDEGRPPAISTSATGTTKSTVIPQKDADGKFPCPHCNKTYLHGKHLKRHLLRRELRLLRVKATDSNARHGRSTILVFSMFRHFQPKRHSQETLSKMLPKTWKSHRSFTSSIFSKSPKASGCQGEINCSTTGSSCAA